MELPRARPEVGNVPKRPEQGEGALTHRSPVLFGCALVVAPIVTVGQLAVSQSKYSVRQPPTEPLVVHELLEQFRVILEYRSHDS